MKITKRQLRRINREATRQDDRAAKEKEIAELDPGSAGAPPQVSPGAWANKHGGDVDRDEEGQTIIYLSKEDYPSERDVMGLLPPGWDYEDTYDETSWVVYTNLYPGGRSDPHAQVIR